MIDPADPRILFAAERTLLAWIRTGVAIMGGGFALAYLGISLWGGIGLVLLGAAMNVTGAIEYAQVYRRFRAGDHRVPQRPIQLATASALLLALGGMAGVFYLLSR